jgi:hypothetical protein
MTKLFSHAFEESGGRCVYCCRDLKADFDSFMLAEEEHLIPKGSPGSDDPENIVIACRVCNALKGKFQKDGSFDVRKKAEYIVAARKHIMEQRARQMEIFAGWVCLPTNVQTRSDPTG